MFLKFYYVVVAVVWDLHWLWVHKIPAHLEILSRQLSIFRVHCFSFSYPVGLRDGDEAAISPRVRARRAVSVMSMRAWWRESGSNCGESGEWSLSIKFKFRTPADFMASVVKTCEGGSGIMQYFWVYYGIPLQFHFGRLSPQKSSIW